MPKFLIVLWFLWPTCDCFVISCCLGNFDDSEMGSSMSGVTCILQLVTPCAELGFLKKKSLEVGPNVNTLPVGGQCPHECIALMFQDTAGSTAPFRVFILIKLQQGNFKESLERRPGFSGIQCLYLGHDVCSLCFRFRSFRFILSILSRMEWVKSFKCKIKTLIIK